MRDEPWVYVLAPSPDFELLPAYLDQELPADGDRRILDGRGLRSTDEFYSRVEQTVPLITGFGRNLDGLVDLFRTFGMGPRAGLVHTFAWYRPEELLRHEPSTFQQIVDILVGVSKELLVGEEADPDFDPSNHLDWVSTRLNLVFACGDATSAEAVRGYAQKLGEFWADEFTSLDVPVVMRVLASELTS